MTKEAKSARKTKWDERVVAYRSRVRLILLLARLQTC